MEKSNHKVAFELSAKVADYLMEILQDRGITHKEILEATGLTKEVLGKILSAGDYNFSDLLLLLQVLKISINFEGQLQKFKVSDPQNN